jgi:hypothetical protein
MWKALLLLLVIWVAVTATWHFREKNTILPESEVSGPEYGIEAPYSFTNKDNAQDRAAVIIENRPLQNLVPVIMHFQSVLGPSWPIIFYTIPTTADTLALSPAFAREIANGRVEIRHIPPEINFSSHHAVSLFLANSWLWSDLAPFDKILLFQTDSIICAASTATMDDFIQYDLVGAPIDPAYGKGFNGGLSIRNRAMTLELVSKHSYANDSSQEGAPANMVFEDQWLYTRMTELPPKEDGSPGARLPSEASAKKFAVETVWAERPLGFHQPVRWQKDHMDDIMKYCPEVGMISGAAFF